MSSGAGLIEEAAFIIDCLWTPGIVREVADDGIPTIDEEGVPSIVSTATGEALWHGSTVPLMWAMWVATKRMVKPKPGT